MVNKEPSIEFAICVNDELVGGIGLSLPENDLLCHHHAYVFIPRSSCATAPQWIVERAVLLVDLIDFSLLMCAMLRAEVRSATG